MPGPHGLTAAISIVIAALAAGCSHRLGAVQVSYDGSARLPIVHPSNDDRWYVVVDSPELGSRLFFLDTGYSYSTCDDDLADELELDLRGKVLVHGEAGTVKARRARVPEFSIGAHRVERLICVVRDLDSTSSIADPDEIDVAGVLGADVLRRFRLVIDPSEPAIALHPRHAGERLDRGAPNVQPIRREYWVGQRFTTPIEVDGQRAWPVVDTGASETHLDGARLGLEPTELREDVAIRASGASGRVVRDVLYYRVEAVAVGPHSVGPVVLTDRPRDPWVPGLLGLDVLVYFRQEYDFRRGLVRFEPVNPATPPSWSDYRATVADE